MKKKAERASAATNNSLRHILKPRSVAVIGASNRTGSIGQLVFQSMISSGFSGVVYPVTPTSNSVMAVKSYPSVLDVPDEIDLAISRRPGLAGAQGRRRVRKEESQGSGRHLRRFQGKGPGRQPPGR